MDIDKLMNNTLGLDDTFAFHCKSCGKCCKHREDILLTPRELFRAAKHLDMTPVAFIKAYCEVYIGDTSGLPIVRLKPVGKTRDCPMLEGKRCRIHGQKPVLCALFPIGRAERYVAPEEGNAPSPDDNTTLYFKTEVDCPTNRNTTVRKWLARFGIEENDTFQKSWSALCIRLVAIIHKMRGDAQAGGALEALWDLIVRCVYLTYETGLPFDAQFERNLHDLDPVLMALEEHMSQEG